MGSEHGLGQSYDRFEVAGVDLLHLPTSRGRRNALLAVHGEVHADGLGLVETLARIAYLGTGKTRSGKILRSTMRDIAAGRDYALPATIDDPAIIDEIAVVLGSET